MIPKSPPAAESLALVDLLLQLALFMRDSRKQQAGLLPLLLILVASYGAGVLSYCTGSLLWDAVNAESLQNPLPRLVLWEIVDLLANSTLIAIPGAGAGVVASLGFKAGTSVSVVVAVLVSLLCGTMLWYWFWEASAAV